jgi:hypothetical protein
MLPEKKYLFTILQTLMTLALVGQVESTHWYFGDSAAIKFVDTGVVALTESAMFSREGCATISDSSGNLLFYTTGFQVWNRDHELMPNGDSLFVPTGLGDPLQRRVFRIHKCISWFR